MYGGRLKNGTLSDELWFYDVTIQRWSQRDFSDFRPPALARHTMTLAHDNWLYVVGGSRIDGSFSDQVYRIKLREGLILFLVCLIPAPIDLQSHFINKFFVKGNLELYTTWFCNHKKMAWKKKVNFN